jgi:hypothetical protein
MKQKIKGLVVVASVVVNLIIASSTQAQYVTGTTYLSNVAPNTNAPNALYANWANPATTTFTSLPTGLEVASTGYGSLYYVIPGGEVQTLNPLDTMVRLTLTVNGNPSLYNWVGLPFTINDNSGAGNYGGYSGSGNPGNPAEITWTGNNVTLLYSLTPTQLAAVQTGTDAIYSFTFQLDPANVLTPGGAYDVTFNSLSLEPVPEPTTLALFGLGAVGLLAVRRRK